jgi:hypothetical protein
MSRMISFKKTLSLALNKDFDTRWIGELPIVFDGTPAECEAYALERGYWWVPDDTLLFGGLFSHPDEPWMLYPV